ncbi:TPA: hypothetical protein LA462_002919 [Clostridium botulinum]|nr:hypothetical protein [Clostridium botulinum]
MNDVKACEMRKSIDYFSYSYQKADINRYFNLFVKTYGKNTLRTNWILIITNEGVLLFIKVIFRISSLAKGEDVRYHFELLQQTSYFKYNNELIKLYR